MDLAPLSALRPLLDGPRVPPAAVAPASEAQAKRPSAEQEEIDRVSGEFAALLVQNLVREMFESVKEGEGPFGSGPGSDIQRSMAETAFSQSIAERGLDSLREAIARAVAPGERLTAEQLAQKAATLESNPTRAPETKR